MAKEARLIATPVILYAIYLFSVQRLLGYSTASVEDGKGIATIGDFLSPAFYSQRYRQSVDGYVNVFEPLLSYYFGSLGRRTPAGATGHAPALRSLSPCCFLAPPPAWSFASLCFCGNNGFADDV